jgi:hypothetical protein
VRTVEIADAEPHDLGPEPPHPVEDQTRGVQQQRHLPVGLPERLGRQHEAEVVRLPRQRGEHRLPQVRLPRDRHMALRMVMVEAEDQGDGDGDLEERELVALPHLAQPPRRRAQEAVGDPRVARGRCAAARRTRSAPTMFPEIRRLQKLSTSSPTPVHLAQTVGQPVRA